MEKARERFEDVVSLFVELKDTSELMIDLAYSSLLFNSRDLAEEVQVMEDYVDRLHTKAELLVLSRKCEIDDERGFLGLIRLGVVTEKIADAAAEISEVVLRGIEPHPILKLTIEEAEETVARLCVGERSPLVNHTLRDARIPEETGMWVLAIRKGKKHIRPRPDTRIEAGDILIASGYAGGEDSLRKLLSSDSCHTDEADT